MIELEMVRRMALRAMLFAPAVIGALWAWEGSRYAVSGAAGLALTVANLWLSGRIIGGVAERDPKLLLPAAMITFTLALALLAGAAWALKAADVVYFPVTGFTLIGTHMVVVLMEAARAYPIPKPGTSPVDARS